MTAIDTGADRGSSEKIPNGFRPMTDVEKAEFETWLKSCRGAAVTLAAEHGWHVFPVKAGTKKSHKKAEYSNGANWGMTNDPHAILRDFTKWPDAGVGVPTGEINLIWVVEADTKEGHGVDGLAVMKRLQEQHGALPETLTAMSPSGSIHWYFNWPDGADIKNSVSAIAHGVDVRGEGGMVVAPPTIRKDGRYKWLNNEPIVDAPQWLIDLATAASTPKKDGSGDGGPHQSSEPQAEISRVAAAMAVIPNDKDSWDDWNKTGMAIYAATGGSDDGFRIFDVWSQPHLSYDPVYTRARWDAYKGCQPKKIGAGSIFQWAEEAQPHYEAIIAAFPDHEVTKRVDAFLKEIGIEPAACDDPDADKLDGFTQDGNNVDVEPDPQPDPPPPQPDPPPKEPFGGTWWCDVKTIPQWRWLYGQHYIRGHASTTVADGGMGKTTLAIIEAICIATGTPLLGISPQEQCNVWYWNGEEPRHEIARRVHAVCVRYGIDPYDLAKTFKFTSGLDEMPIKIATMGKGAPVVNSTLLKNLTAQIRDNDVGLMFLDPFISCHGVPENDNNAIDTVAKACARLAAETNCGMELPHHTRKAARGDNGDAQAADARGAGALINAVRSCRVLNPMSEKEAGEFDIRDRSEFFRVNRGKANMIRRAGSWWYQLVSVPIGNSEFINDPGDEVQTLVAWDPPDTMRDVTDAHAHAVRNKLAAGSYLRDYKAKDRWIGAVVADVVKLDAEADCARIEKIIKRWIKLGVIKIVRREDPKTRHERTFVEPGDWKG